MEHYCFFDLNSAVESNSKKFDLIDTIHNGIGSNHSSSFSIQKCRELRPFVKCFISHPILTNIVILLSHQEDFVTTQN